MCYLIGDISLLFPNHAPTWKHIRLSLNVSSPSVVLPLTRASCHRATVPCCGVDNLLSLKNTAFCHTVTPYNGVRQSSLTV